jgi:hypothetical protein
MPEMDDDELLDALGVEVAPLKGSSRTPREERIIAGFEDILRFHQAHGRVPQHGEGHDIFERLYAVRLDQLRKLPEAQTLLAPLDGPGLLAGASPAMPGEDLDEDALLSELGVNGTPEPDDITVLRHVRSHADIRAAEEIANRTRCKDFDRFKPLLIEAEVGLKAGEWQTKPFGKDASVEVGDFFILGGQTVYVAEMGDPYRTPNAETNARLRVIFSNGTESDLLLRSLQRALYKDGEGRAGRRLVKADAGPLFSEDWEEGDIQSGTIYVLRSQSNHPFVAQHRELIHKIGVTGGKVETRIANAENESTYMLAGVDIVATYKLSGINRTKLEGIFHRIFASAQLDLAIQDRFGKEVRPHEWFLVPLGVIDEAVKRIRDGSITNVRYDPATARLVEQ